MEERVAMLRTSKKTWLREAGSDLEGHMIVIIFLVIVVALLIIVGVFAWMQKDKKREGQSGSPGAASEAKHGRASGLD
jgi:flagellar basal body-associated protein FliL